MKLNLRISQGLAAFLMSAVALSLLLFAGALVLGLAVLALIAAAGLVLAAPDDAKAGLRHFTNVIEKIADRFIVSINELGQIVLTCFAPQKGHESTNNHKNAPSTTTPAEPPAGNE